MCSGAQGGLKKARCQFSSERREGNGNMGTASGNVRGKNSQDWETEAGLETEGHGEGCSETEVLSHACSPDHNESLAEPACKPVPPVTRDQGRLHENTEGSGSGKGKEPRIRKRGV